jgi:hypothetical protein
MKSRHTLCVEFEDIPGQSVFLPVLRHAPRNKDLFMFWLVEGGDVKCRKQSVAVNHAHFQVHRNSKTCVRGCERLFPRRCDSISPNWAVKNMRVPLVGSNFWKSCTKFYSSVCGVTCSAWEKILVKTPYPMMFVSVWSAIVRCKMFVLVRLGQWPSDQWIKTRRVKNIVFPVTH